MTPYVGVRDGQTGTSKYISVSSSWTSPTTVGSAIGCTFNTTCKPAYGLVYRFYPTDLTPSGEQVVIETNYGVSNYAVYLKSCTNYEIVRCQLKPGTAGNGKQGRQGNPGAAANGRTHGGSGAQQGGNGGTTGIGSDATTANSTNGKGGSRGTNGTNYTTGDIGWCEAENGGNGNAGGAGAVGITGATGSVRNIENSDFGEFFAPGISGQGGAGNGGGGGGAGGTGGTAACSQAWALWLTEKDISNGGGGGGGFGGYGGFGGGSSFGLYLFNTQIGTITDCNISTGTAGQGGSGGLGGAGGAGGVGANGSSGSSCPYTCDFQAYGGTGGRGGNGGAGGPGGRGGQGAAGVAYKIAYVNNTGLVNSVSTGYSFDLQGQAEIIAGSDEYPIASCTGIPISMNGITFTSFGNGANPASGESGTNVTYSTSGLKTPSGASGNYSSFINMIQAAPTLPQIEIVGDDTICCSRTDSYCITDNVTLDPSIVINWSVTSSVAEITSVTTGTCVEVAFENNTTEIQYAILRTEFSTSCCGIVKVLLDTITVMPNVVFSLDDVEVCEGENIELNINTNGTNFDESLLCRATYRWQMNENEIGNSNTPILELTNVVPENSGTYLAYIVTACNDIESVTANVTVNPSPSVEVTGVEPVCTGNPSTFTINAIANGQTVNGADVTYTLTVGETSEEFQVTTPASCSHNITANTLLTITSVSIPGGCSAQLNQMFNLELYNDVTDMTAGDDMNVCGTQYTLEASWPSSEWNTMWVLPDNITIDDSSSPVATITYTGTTFPYEAPLQWRFESLNCPGSVVTDDILVTFATPPTLTPSTTGTTNACFYQNMTDLTFEYGGGATGVTVTGFPDSGAPDYGITYDIVGNQILIGGYADGVGTINYTITTTGQNVACAEATVSGNIVIDYCDIPIDGPDPVCQGETATYSTVVPGTYYNWNVDGGTIVSGQGTEEISVRWTAAGENTINVSLIGTNASPTTHVITVNPSYLQEINASICAGETYEEYGFSETESGTYTQTLQTINGCDSTIVLNLTVNPNPVIEFIENNVTCYGFGNGIVSTNVTGGSGLYSYEWSNTNQTAATITSLEPNTYIVTVTDLTTSCTATDTATIVQPDAMNIQLTTNDVQCGISLGNISVSVSGGQQPYSYRWTTGADGSTVENLMQGQYSVTVTDGNYCTLAQSATIRNIGMVPAEIEVLAPISCYGTYTGMLNVTSETAVQPYSCSWSNGASYQTNFNIGAGEYSVTITDAWGCEGSTTYQLDEPSPLNVSSSVTQPKCFGDRTGVISANASGGTSPYNMLWSTGSGANELTGLVAGTYALTVTDGNGCTSVSNFTINWPEELTVDAQATDITCYGGAGGKITATAGGGTPPYEYSVRIGNSTFANGSTYDGLGAGIYTVSVTDINKCSQTMSISIKEPEQIKVTPIVTVPSCTGGRDGSIEIEVTGGVEPYTYAWANSANETNLMTNLIQGTYSISVTDAKGCRVTMNSLALIEHVGDCVKIPNVFTPNGDGINDTWIIENIEMFPEAYIYIYNRWGQLMYEGRGADEPWDGKYRDHFVPAGVYMYIVNLENLEKDRAYTGTVTIMY